MTDDRQLWRFEPGPAIAAAVLIAALLALALLDRGPAGGPAPPPVGSDGPAVQLLPQGGSDASAAQYGRALYGSTLANSRARGPR
jgi:hypothetical protein